MSTGGGMGRVFADVRAGAAGWLGPGAGLDSPTGTNLRVLGSYTVLVGATGDVGDVGLTCDLPAGTKDRLLGIVHHDVIQHRSPSRYLLVQESISSHLRWLAVLA